MAILTVRGVTQNLGDALILENINFEMQKSEHIGLVGPNGSGKTTLLKVLTGEYEPSKGSVSYGREVKLGYMEQHVCRDLAKTAYDEVMTVFSPLIELEEELEEVNRRLRREDDPARLKALISRQDELRERFEYSGGLTYRARVKSALIGLGFSEGQINSLVGVLSGGQKAKLGLAKLLLSGANLLLLDEPTNHLDISSVEWLEDFLRNFPGAYIVVSHDRYFLDRVTERTFEITNGSLQSYGGNYSRFLSLKEEMRIAQERVYENTRREIERVEGIIEQQRQFGQERNFRTIASKQHTLDRLNASLVKPGEDPEGIRFKFKASRRSGDEVLNARDLSISFSGKVLFSGVNLEIRRGEKVFLIGPNGCGKTSLLKILLGQYRADSGTVKLGTGVEPGYYEQNQMSLHDEKTVIDEIWDLYPKMTQTEIRSALAVFLFKGEDVFKQVGSLSGGERARLLLLRLMLSKANFLLLDEPTNHLDISSAQALEDALLGYDGTLFVVSHDRYLINKLADKLYFLSESGAKLYLGNYDYYLEKRDDAIASENEQPKPENPYKLRKERESRLRRMRGALGRLEEKIAENEREISERELLLSDEGISASYERLSEISGEMETLKEREEELLKEWGELSEALENEETESL